MVLEVEGVDVRLMELKVWGMPISFHVEFHSSHKLYGHQLFSKLKT